MAFSKSILQTDAGIAASYWRIVNIHIDAVAQAARIVLAGYMSADFRQHNGKYIDVREYSLTPAQFGALASSESQGVTTFDAIAGACYDFIAHTRRGIPDGAMFDPEARTLTVKQTGEVIPPGLISFEEYFDESTQSTKSYPVSIPSEFADASMV